jgi:hypothetical protein
MAMKNTKAIGDNWLEAKCFKCGEVFTFQKENTTGIYVDAIGDAHPICDKCSGEDGRDKTTKPE